MSSRLKEVFSKNWKKIRNVGVAAGLAGASMMGARGVEASSQDIDQAARDAYRAGMPVETVTASTNDSLESSGLILADGGGGGGARSQEQQGDQQSNPEQQTTPEQEVDLPEIGPVTPAFLRTVDVVEIIPGTNLRSTPSLDGVALRGSGNLPGETFRFVGWTSPDTEGFRWMQLELGQVVDGVFTPVETEGYDTTVYAREDRAFPGSRQSVELRITLSEEELLDLQRSAAAFDPNIENVTMFQDQVMGTRMSASGAYLVLAIYDEQNGAWVDGPAAGITPEPAQIPTSPSPETDTGTPSAPEQQLPPLVPSPEAAQEAPLPPTVQPDASQTPPEETVEEVEQEEQEPESGIQATIPPTPVVLVMPTPTNEQAASLSLMVSPSYTNYDGYVANMREVQLEVAGRVPEFNGAGYQTFTYNGEQVPFGMIDSRDINVYIPGAEEWDLSTHAVAVTDIERQTLALWPGYPDYSETYLFVTFQSENLKFVAYYTLSGENNIENVSVARDGVPSQASRLRITITGLEARFRQAMANKEQVIIQFWSNTTAAGYQNRDDALLRAHEQYQSTANTQLVDAIETGNVSLQAGIQNPNTIIFLNQ